MSEEKPLHVRVAEALGWTSLEIVGRIMLPGAPWDYKGYPPGPPVIGHKESVPRYDTDWSATGPLLERYGIDLSSRGPWRGKTKWDACRGHDAEGFHDEPNGEGLAPLAAVCNLILALKAVGKLPS